MLRSLGLFVGVMVLGLSGMSVQPMAQGVNGDGLWHPKSNYYRSRSVRRAKRGARVRGFARRRVGGYSYASEDTINTYINSRTLFGSNNAYRDSLADRQTSFGPLDHGFFFDSGIAPRGGYSPYLN